MCRHTAFRISLKKKEDSTNMSGLKNVDKREFLIFVGIFLSLAVIFFPLPLDPDLGWHLKMGEYIFNNRSVPLYDWFSYTMRGYAWADSYWLTQVIMHLLYKFGGLVLLTGFFSFISAGSVLLAGRIKKLCSFRELLILLVFSLLIRAAHLGVRPLVFSSVFLVITWNVLKDFIYERKVKGLIVLPFVFLIWANMHADFVAGLLLVAGVLFVESFLSLCKKAVGVGRGLFYLLCSLLLSIAATFVNPYRGFLWETLLKETSPLQFAYIAEWGTPSDKDPYLFYLYILVLSITFIILWYRRKQLRLSEILAVAVVGLISVRFTYAIRPFILLALGLWIRYFNFETFLGKKIVLPPNNSKLVRGFFWFYGFALVFYVLYTFVPTVTLLFSEGKVLEKGGYPVKAVKFLRENSYNGNIFNTYGWGGFLIWKYPEAKTFIDGRMPSWSENEKSIFAHYIDISMVKINAGELIRSYKIDYFLIEKDSTLAKALEINSFWEKTYSDNISVIYKRKAEW